MRTRAASSRRGTWWRGRSPQADAARWRMARCPRRVGVRHPVPGHHRDARAARHRSRPATSSRWRPPCTTRWAGFRPTWRDAPVTPGSGRSARSRPPASTAPIASASNSLLEGLVFADRAGRALAGRAGPVVHGHPAGGAGARSPALDEGCEEIRREMRELMTGHVGLQRTEASLLHAEQELDRAHGATPEGAWRTRNQLLVARLITQAARRRRESRGGHRRLDYPPPGSKPGDRRDRGHAAAPATRAAGHRAHPRDARADRRPAGRRSASWPGGATRWCWRTTISGPKCRTSPTTSATRSASPARPPRPRPR